MIPLARLDTPDGKDLWLPPSRVNLRLATVMQVWSCRMSYKFAPAINHAPSWNAALKPLGFVVQYGLKSSHWIEPPTHTAFWNAVDQCIKEQHHEDKDYISFLEGSTLIFSAVHGYEKEWILVDYPIYYWAPACVFLFRRSKLIHVPSGRSVLACDYGQKDNCHANEVEFDCLTWHPWLEPWLSLPVLCRRIVRPTDEWGSGQHQYSRRHEYWGWPFDTSESLIPSTSHRAIWTTEHRNSKIKRALSVAKRHLLDALWVIVFNYAWLPPTPWSFLMSWKEQRTLFDHRCNILRLQNFEMKHVRVTSPSPLATWMNGAASGDAHMQWCMGMAYEKGMYGIPQNNNIAVEWYEKAAAQGHAMAEGKLGVFYCDGGGGVRGDYKRAAQLWQRAAMHGEIRSMGNLGECYCTGEGIAKDHEKGMGWLSRGAAMGDERSHLSMCVHDPKRYRVDDVLRKCNDLSQVSAIRMLGWIYSNGLGGVKKDEKAATTSYERAANLDDLNAQWLLFYCYRDGRGVAQDKPKAIEWLRKAADSGLACAQADLGSAYEHGVGVKIDKNEAMKWYKMAADQGNSFGLCAYGFMCGSVLHDQKSAIEWTMQAAMQNYPQALFNLYTCYRDGLGVKQDDKRAAYWLTKAALAEHDVAQRELCAFRNGIKSALLFDVKPVRDWIAHL